MGGGDRSSSAVPTHSFRIVSTLTFHLRRNLSQCPSNTQTLEKQTTLVWALSKFSVFARFFCGLEFSHFPLFGWACFRGNGPPARGLFPPPRPLPNQKPLTQNSQTQWKTQPCKLVIAAGSPQAFYQCRCICVVRQYRGQGMQRPKDGGIEINTACKS